MSKPMAIQKYKEATMRVLQNSFPDLTFKELEEAVDYSLNKSFRDTDINIHNNYVDQTKSITLSKVTDYILIRQPIITSYGVMFKRHSQEKNPLGEMLLGFLDDRAKIKKKMLSFPKGSEEYEKYNLAQSLKKISANGAYGAMGMHACLFYNIYSCASITTQGRSLISSASLLFEMFLNNNCKFNSFNEIITFISNIKSEKCNRKYRDEDFLDNPVDRVDCFIKLIDTCGFDYIPSEEDLDILWNMILNMDQENINRIYYKNNLFGFMDNSSMTTALLLLLQTLDEPYLDPNHPPKEIEAQLDEFTEILMEYVYYGHQIIDRLAKYDNMYRSVSIITDTDSSIISLDGWYRYALQKTYGVDMKIKHQEVNEISMMDVMNGEEPTESPIEEVDEEEYSFFDDDIILAKRAVSEHKIVAQDNLRFSIINIMAYTLTHVVNDYMVKYCMNSHSIMPGEREKCLMYMKNEFLFKKVLISAEAKKNYASKMELQEGKQIPDTIEASLDIKGLDMNKSELNPTVRTRLKEIMYDEVVNNDSIDQIRVIKAIGKLEKDIYNSLMSGSKEFYKPMRVKGMGSYVNPLSEQGVKASLVYNELRDEFMEVLDLNDMNTVDIVKVLINHKTVEKIKDKYPDKYAKICQMLDDPIYKKEITSIAIPLDTEPPKWLFEFIDYNKIVTDNIRFPLESLGIYSGKANYTNIVKL